MRYTWTPEKNLQNLAKHKLAFKDAIRVFEAITVEQEDDRFDDGDVCVYAIGLVNGLEIPVIYTDIHVAQVEGTNAQPVTTNPT